MHTNTKYNTGSHTRLLVFPLSKKLLLCFSFISFSVNLIGSILFRKIKYYKQTDLQIVTATSSFMQQL